MNKEWTTIPLKKKTRRELNLLKAQLEHKNYDELINWLLNFKSKDVGELMESFLINN